MRAILPDVYDDVLEEKLKKHLPNKLKINTAIIFIYDNINKPKLCSIKKIAVNFFYISCSILEKIRL